MISINVTSRHYNLSLDLKYKITVIRGNSGRGKSIFFNAVLFPQRGRYKITVSDGFTLIPLIETTYRDSFDSGSTKEKRIYITDDDDFVFTKEFAEYVKVNTKDMFVIINRFEKRDIKSLGGLPFCYDAVLRWKCSGINHWTEPYYNYDSDFVFNKFDVVLIEDRKYGYSFFESLIGKGNILSLDGKDSIDTKVIDMLDSLVGKKICLLVDLSAFGCCFESLYNLIKRFKLCVYLNPNYLSFEYMLLRSNMFKFSLNDVSLVEQLKYMSLEHLCEDYIHRLTSGKSYKYTKKYPINGCYIEDCCRMTKNPRDCDRGISGDKLHELFRGTEFEDLIEVLLNS